MSPLSLFTLGHTHEHNWYYTLPYFLFPVLQLLKCYINNTEILYLLKLGEENPALYANII